MTDLAVVWGNCQAAPIADLLTGPLREAGLEVVSVPPVYLATAADVARVHDLLPRCRLLVSQPVGDDYPQPGTSTSTLAGLLPRRSRLVTFPVAFHVGPFPWSVHGHDGDGGRIDAPLTDYHDLRVLLAARGGCTVDGALANWPSASRAGIRAVAAASLAELRRREDQLDVAVSDLLDLPDALWTMTHPSNATLATTAQRILDVLGVRGVPTPPDVEYLGQRRAPTPTAPVRHEWVVDGVTLPWADVLAAQLSFYRDHPGVVEETLRRASARLALLGT